MFIACCSTKATYAFLLQDNNVTIIRIKHFKASKTIFSIDINRQNHNFEVQ